MRSGRVFEDSAGLFSKLNTYLYFMKLIVTCGAVGSVSGKNFLDNRRMVMGIMMCHSVNVNGTAPVRFARYLPVSVEPVRGFSGLFENAATAISSGSCP
jgi:hypothetical protein